MNLIREAGIGRLEDVRKSLSEGAEINAKDEIGRTPLMIAAKHGHLEIVKLLIEEGADLNAKDKNQDTALNHAFLSGHAEIEEMLLQMNADFHFENLFAYIDKPRGLAMCIERGADVNQVNEYTGLTALHQAVRGHAYESAKLLIEKGADVNARERDVLNKRGYVEKAGRDNPVLAEAATHVSPKMIELLIEGGADVNAKSAGGFTALMVAAGRGNTKVVEKLIEAGADVNAKAGNGKTALQLAEEREYIETASVIRRQSR